MKIFSPTRPIDFLKFRAVALSLSLVLILLSVYSLWGKGLNYGVDFAGGTELQLKFAAAPSVAEVRDRLQDVELADSAIQRYGDPALNEILIRTPLIEVEQEQGTGPGAEDRPEGDTEEPEGDARRTVDVVSLITDALHSEEERAKRAEGRLDLNLANWQALAALWTGGDPEHEKRGYYEGLGRRIVHYRKQHGGLIQDYEELRETADDDEFAVLEGKTFLGPFTVRRVDRVGAKVGEDLRGKAILAAVWSLAAILCYMWFRFELRFGVAAILAAAHDTVVVLGVLSLLGTSFDLTVVAAVLTLIGYSLNDSIIILDRVRENIALRRRDNFYDLLNWSVTQMLVRTFLTSLSTIIVVGGLFFFAGEAVHAFSSTLLVGVVVGTYSSLFIVLPVLLHWKKRPKKSR
ncbi:MAG: protein translocase subunit SecF [Acidobacteriota bacterium]|nr:MAG: protein translocase subunit SecF [Acidobacteriota bacterium]